MFIKYYNKVQYLLKSGQPRSIKAKQNILISLAARGIDIMSSLVLVRLSLDYLGETNYGLWLTISSIVAWFGILNIGLGNGLRNKFAEAKANGENELAKKYVSTTYASIIIIMGVFLSIFLVVNHFINWSNILNAPQYMRGQLSLLAIIIFVSFSTNMVFQIATSIATADQKPSIVFILNSANKLFILASIFVLFALNIRSLLYYGIVSVLIPLISLIILSVYYYKYTYRYVRPSLNYIDFKHAKSLINLGWKFLILQTGAIVLMMTDNIIIAQLYKPSDVTRYQIAYKYFGLILTIFVVIVSPFWSAVTEAFVKKDYQWIQRAMKSYLSIGFFFSIIVIIMFIMSNYLYGVWLGYDIKIPMLLSAFVGIYIVIQIVNTLFSYFINGVGYLRISLIISSVTIITNIPLSIFLSLYVFHDYIGVMFGSIISVALSMVVLSIQYHKIINKKAIGIWSK